MLYEYACVECDHHFDVRHGANEKPHLTCPLCQGEVKKVFNVPGLIFKGSGWYVTDSVSKKPPPDAPVAKPAEPVKAEATPTTPAAEATAASPTKTESKPVKKASSKK